MTTDPAPRVSVLMAVFNGAPFLRPAIDSILAQTFRTLEFIIVDDGSVDDTPAILASYEDPRLIIIRNDQNRGLAASLNRGLDVARGEFVARMDADDVAMTERLKRQVIFLDSHPDVGIVGSASRLIDAAGREHRRDDMPLSDLAIRWRLLTGNPFQHPTVMVRRAILDRHRLRYDETCEAAQDYDLWTRLLDHTRGANLPEPLVARRVHGAAVSRVRATVQSEAHVRIALRAISSVWPDHPFTAETFADLARLLTTTRPLPGPADRRRCELLVAYADLLARFAERHRADEGTGGLRRQQAVMLAFLALTPPWCRGVVTLAGRLTALEPRLAGALMAWALGAAGRRLVGRKA